VILSYDTFVEGYETIHSIVQRTRKSGFIRTSVVTITFLLNLVAYPGSIKPEKAIFADDFEKGLSKTWKEHVFQGHTNYKIVQEGTNHVLRAHAASAASGIGTELQAKVVPGTTLSWRWKIESLPAGASDRDLTKFDHTVRLYIAFKSMLVPRTINYIWSAEGKPGEQLNHPSSNRARIIRLESGSSKAGQWVLEKRDLYQDWKTLFGNEEPPEIQSIGLMTDSDGTKTEVIGFYDDLLLTHP
jgi:hypothetical protein